MKIQVTPAQRQVLLCPARFIFMGAGRRFGKTYTAESRLKYKAATIPSWHSMFLTPVISQNEESFENILSDGDFAPYVKRTRTRPGKIWLHNGSRIDFRSMQVSRHIRGRGLNEIWIDESQDIDKDDYQRIIRPTVSDRRGNIILSGQFRGRQEWRFRDFYEPGLHPPGSAENPIFNGAPLYQSFRFPSSAGIKFQGDEGRAELELARRQLPKFVYDTEYECLIVDNPQAVFTAEQIERITGGEVLTAPERDEYGPKPSYVIGLDLGRSVDVSAAVVMNVKTGQVVHTETFPLKEEHAAQAYRAGRLARKFNATVVVDSTGGATGGKYPIDSFVKLYREQCPHIRPVWLNQAVKTDIIGALTLAVQQRHIRIPAVCTKLLEEMANYTWERKGALFSFQGPNGGHNDDLVMALSLAWWGIVSNWCGFEGGTSVAGIM